MKTSCFRVSGLSLWKFTNMKVIWFWLGDGFGSYDQLKFFFFGFHCPTKTILKISATPKWPSTSLVAFIFEGSIHGDYNCYTVLAQALPLSFSLKFPNLNRNHRFEESEKKVNTSSLSIISQVI
jgi:hypothetical protein